MHGGAERKMMKFVRICFMELSIEICRCLMKLFKIKNESLMDWAILGHVCYQSKTEPKFI